MQKIFETKNGDTLHVDIIRGKYVSNNLPRVLEALEADVKNEKVDPTGAIFAKNVLDTIHSMDKIKKDLKFFFV